MTEGQLTFLRAGAFSPVEILPNPDVAYDYAIALNKPRLEMRFLVTPEMSTPDPQAAPAANMAAVIFNAAGGAVVGPNLLPQGEVGREFNADWGAVCSFRLKSTGFGKGFQGCVMTSLARYNGASAHQFLLYDDFAEVEPMLERLLYPMRFLPKEETSAPPAPPERKASRLAQPLRFLRKWFG